MTKLFYFSGTGNSLHLTSRLSEQIEDSVTVSMATDASIKQEKLLGTVGFIFPVHAFSLPKAVEAFIKNLTFDEDTYIFAIATRMGSSCKVFQEINKILEKQKVKLSAHWFVDMPNNYLTLLPLSDEEKVLEINKEADVKLNEIATIVNEQKKCFEKDSHYSFLETNILFPMLSKVYKKTNYFGLENKFHVEDTCNNCSLCKNICLSSKIQMKDDKPYWQKDVKCYHCLACIHYCPKQAIQLSKKTKKIGRYHHQEVSAKQIEAQKSDGNI